jgi:hypothetical protein
MSIPSEEGRFAQQIPRKTLIKSAVSHDYECGAEVIRTSPAACTHLLNDCIGLANQIT